MLHSLLRYENSAARSEAIPIVCVDTDILALAVTRADETGIYIYHRRRTESQTRPPTSML